PSPTRGTPVLSPRAPQPSRQLVDGVPFATDLGTWHTLETPGHAPSHVCFFQPERRLLISGWKKHTCEGACPGVSSVCQVPRSVANGTPSTSWREGWGARGLRTGVPRVGEG